MEREKVWREFMGLSVEDQRKVADFIASLREEPRPSRPDASPNLEDEPSIGMWSDREDMEDSVAWTREIRRSEWTKRRR
ncbi:MAG: DUF2281 domain-containing protein [Rubrobacteraceae bacterium]